MKLSQRMARREGWLDNVTNTIFSLAKDDSNTHQGVAPDVQTLEADLEKQYTLMKEEIQKKSEISLCLFVCLLRRPLQQRGHLETAPPFTVPCIGREAW